MNTMGGMDHRYTLRKRDIKGKIIREGEAGNNKGKETVALINVLQSLSLTGLSRAYTGGNSAAINQCHSEIK